MGPLKCVVLHSFLSWERGLEARLAIGVLGPTISSYGSTSISDELLSSIIQDKYFEIQDVLLATNSQH